MVVQQRIAEPQSRARTASTEPRQAGVAGRTRRAAALVAAALVLAAAADPAAAKPKRRDAKAAFERGVAAYQRGDFDAASEALARSFGIERDVDTLFAWAQAERKLEHCDKAIELYEKLLSFELPEANREAVVVTLSECRAVLAEQNPAAEPPPAEPPRTESPPPPVAVRPVIAPPPADPGPQTRPSTRVWYRDPVALSLLGTGAVGLGLGSAFLVSAQSLHNDAGHATTYPDAKSLSDRARSRGTIGLVTIGAGGALAIGGAVWIATHRGGGERAVVTGWVAPGGAGLGLAGGF
jgi:tetratricopeptide (TPR) repeat protein